MQISLTNTLTRRKEVFAPSDPKRVTMYVCGPTVYNYAHIGNMRPPVVFDTLFRLLRHVYGPDHVVYARNYTDIDDRIIAQAIAGNVPIETITDKFKAIYDEDTAALGVLPTSLSPRATQHVPGMIKLIEGLIEKGAAYVVPTGVYFSVGKDADYGKLSGRAQEDLQAGARVEGEDDKRHPSDFALWKTAKPGEPAWDASFGRGRPGWHIECSAMIEEELGSPIDIHGGGLDLIFPHHENEIAQSETAHGHPLARVWMHNGFLTMNTEKMSKSLGNIITPRELLEQGWQGEVLRWALLSAHYKAPLDFNDDLLKQSRASLDRLYGTLREAKNLIGGLPDEVLPPDSEKIVAELLEPFIKALSDDLNTPDALAELFGIRGHLGIAIKFPGDENLAVKERATALLRAGLLVGFLQADPNAWFKAASGSANEIDELVAQRDAARRSKDWALADALRQEIAKRWANVQDGKEGAQWVGSLNDESFERVTHEFLEDEPSVDYDVEFDGLTADAIIRRDNGVAIVEAKMTLARLPQAAAQAAKIAEKVEASGQQVFEIVIVAPNTSANNALLSNLTKFPATGTEARFLTINGLGEVDIVIVVGPDGKVRI